MSIIKCKTCGAQFKSEDGRCPVCRELPEGNEEVIAASAPDKKRSIPAQSGRQKIAVRIIKSVIALAAAAAVLVPAGKGAYGYFTSPETYMNRGEYEKAFDKAGRSDRERLLEELLSAGKYGKAYDSVKKKDRSDIYLESQIANFARSSYDLLYTETDGRYGIDSGEYSLTGAWNGESEKYEMYVLELTRMSDTSDSSSDPYHATDDPYKAIHERYYFFFADSGERCEYKTADSASELEDMLGINIYGYSISDYDYDDDYDYDYDYDYDDSYSILTSEYDGGRLGKTDSDMVSRVRAMIKSGLYDDAEYLGADKKP